MLRLFGINRTFISSNDMGWNHCLHWEWISAARDVSILKSDIKLLYIYSDHWKVPGHVTKKMCATTWPNGLYPQAIDTSDTGTRYRGMTKISQHWFRQCPDAKQMIDKHQTIFQAICTHAIGTSGAIIMLISMDPMGKWPWHCTSTGQDGSSKLYLEWICLVVAEIQQELCKILRAFITPMFLPIWAW